ncbi:MAG: DUF1559 domain-containing protein [Pirellulales bacterium]|nr:DUF1559 domain-containing protein [Pirellulales bacterium]
MKLLLATTIVLAAPRVSAAEVPIADTLASLMDDEAIAVARIDLERADPAGLAKIFSFMPDLAEGLPAPEVAVGVAQHISAKAGPVVYFILSVPTSNKLPIVCVVPLADPARKESAPQAFHIAKSQRDWRHEVVDNLLIAGPKDRVDRLLAGRDAAQQTSGAQPSSATPPRPYLAAALAAAGDAPVALAYVPSADQQRVLDELTPELPAEVGANTLRDLVRATRWVATAYEHRKSLRVTLATESEAAAKQALENVDGLLGALMLQGRLTNPNSAESQLFKLLGPVLAAIEPRQAGERVVLEVGGEQLAALFPPADQVLSGVVGRQPAMNKLKQLALAMHNFANQHKKFPDAATAGADGKPLLSWRVQILPYLEEGGDALYKEFKLDEPWDSEHNKKLIERMPDVFKLPGSKAPAGQTCAVLPVGDATVVPKGKGMSFRQITDGTSNTILIVETDDEHAVPWTAPNDLKFDPEKPAAGLGGHYGEGFLAVLCDGSVHFLGPEWPVETLRALFTPAGREVIERP